jgi:hypothetical protein
MRQTTKDWVWIIATFLFFALSPVSVFLLHKLHQIIINSNIGYDSVIGSIGVIWYIFIAIVLAISIYVAYLASDKTSQGSNQNAFLQKLFIAELLGFTIGVLAFLIYGVII